MNDYQGVSAGIENAYAIAASHASEGARIITSEMIRPSVTMRPKLLLDGDKWCALYGENLAEGVAGFGESPAKACEAFDVAWYRKVKP